MSLRLGDIAPDFEQDSSVGRIQFHEWLGDSWGVLFSHPKDYTPVCTTELGMAAKMKPEFDKRNVKIMGLSVDPLDSHSGWAKDIEEPQGAAVNFPMNAGMPRSVERLNAKSADYVQALKQVKQEVMREPLTGPEVEKQIKAKLEELAK